MEQILSTFLDVGHAYGAKAGAQANGIVEEEFNLEIRNLVMSVYSARVAIENLLMNFSRHIADINGFISPLLYNLVVNSDEPTGLNGKYADRIRHAMQMGVDTYIQMHCNAGGGKYAIIGYNNYGDARELSAEMADIFAKTYKEEIEKTPFDTSLSDIYIWPCTTMDADDAHRRIANCLNAATIPAILVEPFFLDNEAHAAYMSTTEGKNMLARVYLKAMDRIAEVFTEQVV